MIQQTVTVIRAIGAEYIRRFLKPLAIGAALIMTALVAVGGWLTTRSGWWWLLEIVFIGLAILCVIAFFVVRFLIRLADTAQTNDQKLAVKAYVDTLERVAETVQTPQPIIVFKVIKDMVRPSPDGIIQTMSRDTRSLAPEYAVLTRRFSGVAGFEQR